MSRFKVLITLLFVFTSIILPASKVKALDLGGLITSTNYQATQHSDYTLLNLEHALFCQTAGFSVIQGQKCVGYQMGENNAVPKLWSKVPDGGAIGSLNSAMVAMYISPPASTNTYLAYLKENLGIAKPAYAANISGISGNGSDVLIPVLRLWVLARNIAYVAFILVFIVVGFMIMFRQKINPQTVISAQQALPGLIIGLVLITFSYLIASVIIDISFIAMQLVAALFISAGVSNASQIANTNVFNLFWGFMWSGVLGNIITGFSNIITPSNQAASILGNLIIGGALGPLGALIAIVGNPFPTVADYIGHVATRSTGGTVGLLVAVIVIIAFLIQMLRLIWALLSAYITILVMTVIGPLIILISSIPGRGQAISYWWKTLLANVLIFPAVLAAFLFALAILGNTDPIVRPMPMMGGLPATANTDLLKALLGLGIVFGTPAIPGMVKQAFGVKDIQGLPQAAIAGFMGGVGASTAGYGRLTAGATQEQRAWRESELRNRFTPVRPGEDVLPMGPRPRRRFPWIY